MLTGCIGPEENIRLFLVTIGGFSEQLHDEIWVFDQGYWSKSRTLYNEIQKADWKDVILKEPFKRALQKDVEGFFSSEEVYQKLAIPWKVHITLLTMDISLSDLFFIARPDYVRTPRQREDH